ncbi:MAG: FHA domain-containing protein [Pirellulales bacterium]
MILPSIHPQRREEAAIQLQIETFDSPSRTVVLDHLPALIGRKRDVDVWVNDRFVSHLHGILRSDGGDLVIQDLDSRNGIRVNGRLADAVSLTRGDSIELGMSRIVVEAIAFGRQSGS